MSTMIITEDEGKMMTPQSVSFGDFARHVCVAVCSTVNLNLKRFDMELSLAIALICFEKSVCCRYIYWFENLKVASHGILAPSL